MPHPRTIAGVALVVAAFAAGPAGAIAANPGTTGQPNQSCEDQPAAPAGFGSGGFANADTHYAGSGPSASHAGSGAAVSQYDVACFEVSSRP